MGRQRTAAQTQALLTPDNVKLKQEEVITAREANVLNRPRPDQISRIRQCFMEVAASGLISGREINQQPLVVAARRVNRSDRSDHND